MTNESRAQRTPIANRSAREFKTHSPKTRMQCIRLAIIVKAGARLVKCNGETGKIIDERCVFYVAELAARLVFPNAINLTCPATPHASFDTFSIENGLSRSQWHPVSALMG